MTRWYYLDTSAWAKRYLVEAGTESIHKLFDDEKQLCCSVLGRVEIVAALARRSRAVGDLAWDGPMRSLVASDWETFVQVGASPEIWQQAAGLAGGFGLRAADAVHLASAVDLGRQLGASAELTFVSADSELNQAAAALGVTVMNPAEEDA